MRTPIVRINNQSWHKLNGLRITTITGHGGGDNMYSIADARELSRLLKEACDEVEGSENVCKEVEDVCKEAFLTIGKKLGFIDG